MRSHMYVHAHTSPARTHSLELKLSYRLAPSLISLSPRSALASACRECPYIRLLCLLTHVTCTCFWKLFQVLSVLCSLPARVFIACPTSHVLSSLTLLFTFVFVCYLCLAQRSLRNQSVFTQVFSTQSYMRAAIV
jgi:hypothetical protein